MNPLEYLERWANRSFILFLAVVFANAALSMHQNNSSDWGHYCYVLTFTALELSPVVAFIYLAHRYQGRLFCTLQLVGMVLFPLGLMSYWYYQPQNRNSFVINELAFIVLWIGQLAFYAESKIKDVNARFFVFKFSLDNIFMMLLLLSSLFMALIFNSNNGPLNHQPIPLSIDVFRNYGSVINVP